MDKIKLDFKLKMEFNEQAFNLKYNKPTQHKEIIIHNKWIISNNHLKGTTVNRHNLRMELHFKGKKQMELSIEKLLGLPLSFNKKKM